MHPVYILAFVTFAAIAGFIIWNYLSTRRHQASSGIGGPADPMSGTTRHHIRSGAEIRASLDTAQERFETGAPRVAEPIEH